GVVTAVTKSGGNEFSGSLRVNMTNDDWRGSIDFSPERNDDRREAYEATFGGRVVRDRQWFFLAGRQFENPGTPFRTDLGVVFNLCDEEDRTEGKLTISLTQAHQLQLSYTEIETVQFNRAHG